MVLKMKIKKNQHTEAKIVQNDKPYWIFAIAIPILVFSGVYFACERYGLSVTEEKVQVAMLGVTGVLSASLISAIYAHLTLQESRNKTSNDSALSIELEKLRYKHQLRFEEDKKTYEAACARIYTLERSATNGLHALQELVRFSDDLGTEKMLSDSMLAFITLAPVFVSPPPDTPVLPSDIQNTLRELRLAFIQVILALNVDNSQRRHPSITMELKSKLNKLEEQVKEFTKAGNSARKIIQDDLVGNPKD